VISGTKEGFSSVSETSLPLQGVRVLERSGALAGRLTGLLLADQGAAVFALDPGDTAEENIDQYLNRGKNLVPAHVLAADENPDILIGDNDIGEARPPWQISLGFTGVVPGDEDCDLPPDASDDLLNGMVGFYTDLCVTRRLLGREVIYTPLPLCSVYAAVLGATAVCAALADRQRTGAGRAIVIPRLAAGLSAIGALAMGLEGIEPHLVPPSLLSLAPELAAEAPRARASETHMVRLANRLNPTAGCYRSADGRLLMPVTTVNRKLAIRMFEVLGLWERVQRLGIVDASPYDPANKAVAERNIALPQGMRADLNIQLAVWVEEAFAARTAAEWETLFAEAEVPCAIVQDFAEWINCSWAKDAGLVETVGGLEHPQLGRAIAVRSAQPYPPLTAGRRVEAAAKMAPSAPQGHCAPARKPLTGYVVLDLTNVIAGPAGGRLLGELGATVLKMDTTRPDHQPLVTVVWGAEANQGKKSILADLRTIEGRQILTMLAGKADIVLMNATDSGVRRLGLTAEQLHEINPRAIGVQISAFKGARPSSHFDRPGYDPLLQAATGIMTRFGSSDMPLLHGIASCVDYLTGYLGAFAAVTALQARERRGDDRGDWVDASLASAAALTQLLFQYKPAPATATGPAATGPSPTARLHHLSDGWIFAESATDVSGAIAGLSVAEAIDWLRRQGSAVAPVRSIATLKARYLQGPSATVRFRTVGKEGLRATLLEPTWFQFEGRALSPPDEPPRPGADACEVLHALGFDIEACQAMLAAGSIGRTDWTHLAST
jgi:crotonobetainyl-CoA:carnitine CoA-transferase CaiB-like acyl-CoA transferase